MCSDIPNEIKKTIGGADFLLYEGKTEDENRIIIFFHCELIHLTNSSIWVFDGTFNVVPCGFVQLCTLQAKI
jgi:hypothetical protein